MNYLIEIRPQTQVICFDTAPDLSHLLSGLCFILRSLCELPGVTALEARFGSVVLDVEGVDGPGKVFMEVLADGRDGVVRECLDLPSGTEERCRVVREELALVMERVHARASA